MEDRACLCVSLPHLRVEVRVQGDFGLIQQFGFLQMKNPRTRTGQEMKVKEEEEEEKCQNKHGERKRFGRKKKEKSEKQGRQKRRESCF